MTRFPFQMGSFGLVCLHGRCDNAHKEWTLWRQWSQGFNVAWLCFSWGWLTWISTFKIEEMHQLLWCRQPVLTSSMTFAQLALVDMFQCLESITDAAIELAATTPNSRANQLNEWFIHSNKIKRIETGFKIIQDWSEKCATPTDYFAHNQPNHFWYIGFKAPYCKSSSLNGYDN